MAHSHTQPVLGALIIVAVAIVGVGLFIVTTTTTPVQFAGYPVVVFGVLVAGGSMVVVLQKPSEDYVAGLTESDVQTVARPATIISFVKAIGWFLAGLVGAYLLTTEPIPLLWPAILTVVGPYFHAKNVAIVWRNSLTRYYVTDREVIRVRKFLTISETETGISKLTDIRRTRGVFQRLIGYGDVIVESSSGGSSASIRARSIKSPDRFKQIIKQSQQRFGNERDIGRQQQVDPQSTGNTLTDDDPTTVADGDEPARPVTTDTASAGDTTAQDVDGRHTPDERGTADTHEKSSVTFVDQPTVGDESVRIRYDIGSSLGQPAQLRLFSEIGGQRQDEKLDLIDAGQTDVRTYDVPTDLFTIGDNVEVRAFPQDWSQFDEFIAADRTTVSGIRFTNPPHIGDSTVTIEYSYSIKAAGTGSVALTVGDSVASDITGPLPGTFEQTTVDIGTLSGEDRLSLTLYDVRDERIDTTEMMVTPEDYASLALSAHPTAGGRSLSLKCELSSDHSAGQSCALRLYTESSLSTGTLLRRLDPGDDITEEIEISTHEPGVPFERGAEPEIMLVDRDDPHARRPLAKATARVEQSRQDHQKRQSTGMDTDRGSRGGDE